MPPLCNCLSLEGLPATILSRNAARSPHAKTTAWAPDSQQAPQRYNEVARGKGSAPTKGDAMSKTKKILVALIAALTLTAGLSLVACSSGEAPEDAIRADLAAQFDPIKNHDQEVMDELTASVESAGLDEYGVSNSDFVASLLDGFDYTVDSISVAEDGNTATAAVTMTCKTFTDATARAEELSAEFGESDEVLDMSTEEINAKIGEIMMQAINETEPKATSCEFGYTLVDGTWTIDSSAESEIYNAFFA